MTQKVQGRDLRMRRMQAGVSQTEMAKELGMARTVLSLIENEHTPLDDEFRALYTETLGRLTSHVQREAS